MRSHIFVTLFLIAVSAFVYPLLGHASDLNNIKLAANSEMVTASNSNYITASTEQVAPKLAPGGIKFVGDSLFNLASMPGTGGNPFKVHAKVFSIRLVGSGTAVTKINVNASLYSLFVKKEQRAKLESYFVDSGLSKASAKKLTTVLIAGVKHDQACTLSRTTCTLPNDKLRFVIDFYKKTLRIFIPSSFFLFKKEKEKYMTFSKSHSQLVSHIYASTTYTNKHQQTFLRLNNKLGFYSGFANLDWNYANDETRVTNAYYQHDYNRYSILTGKLNGISQINISSQNSELGNSDFYGVALGKTDNLLINDKEEKKLQFYSTSEGTLEVSRNGRVIYQTYIASGLNKIAYSALPLGRYTVSITVRKSDSIVYQGNDYVDNVVKGQLDGYYPYFRLGELAVDKKADYTNEVNQYFHPLIESGINLPISQNWSYNINAYAVKDYNPFATLGLNYNNDNWYFRASSSSDGASVKNSIYTSYNYFSLNGSWIHLGDDDKSLPLFKSDDENKHDFFRANLTMQYPLMYGIYLNGSVFYDESIKHKDEEDEVVKPKPYFAASKQFDYPSLYDYLKENEILDKKSLQYSLGLSKTFASGANLYLNWSQNGAENSTQLSLSIPINTSFNSDTFYSRSGTHSSAEQNLSYSSHINDENSYSISSGVSYNDLNKVSPHASASIFHDSSAWSGSASILKENGISPSVSASFQTTQYVNKEGIFYNSDSDKDASIFVANSGSAQQLQGEMKIKDKQTSSEINEKFNTNGMYYFKGYDALSVQLKTQSQFQKSNNVQAAVDVNLLPGTYNYLSVDVDDTSEVQVMYPPLSLKKISCRGQGCLNAENLTSGVAKATVYPKKPADIYFDDKFCGRFLLARKQRITIICD